MPTAQLVADLASELLQQNFSGNRDTRRSWMFTIEALKLALSQPATRTWTLLLEYPLLRVGKRADALLLTDRAIFVLEFKTGETSDVPSAKRQADDYALDLFDFHAGCRAHPIIPVAVTKAMPKHPPHPLLIRHGVVEAQHCAIADLGSFLRESHAAIPEPSAPLDAAIWLRQPYRPIPNIVEAARMAFARHTVPEINATRADGGALRRTTTAILAEIAGARDRSLHRVIFVTGIPGAGKTRCGLAVAFETPESDRAVYLTGNPTLVHVFREALAKDAMSAGVQATLARQRMEQRIQALPKFRDYHVEYDHPPDEHVIVIDEAQRSWSRIHAIKKTQTRLRPPPLTDSEPAHILDAMARHKDWAVIVALIGSGQEIHDGEGGLAEWAEAIASRPIWSIAAADQATRASDPRQRLPSALNPHPNAALHLDVAVRQLAGQQTADWVDAVIGNDITRARTEAAKAPLPFFLTRDLGAMRSALRDRARGKRRAGLVASSGAKRLRAEGLGVELPHMDDKAVARWFLEHWPLDIRASDSLEVVATEFSCQGLELDYVGMAWGNDLIRRSPQDWKAPHFHGTEWRVTTDHEAFANQLNTYRVLLTRARYETIIFVPLGDPPGREHPPSDQTRPSPEFDAIAAYLLACGARPLTEAPTAATSPAMPEPQLL